MLGHVPPLAVAVGRLLQRLLYSAERVIADPSHIGSASPVCQPGGGLRFCGHKLVLERLGGHRALDLLYAAELMSGSEAATAGFFCRVFPDADILELTRARAPKVATGATGVFPA